MERGLSNIFGGYKGSNDTQYSAVSLSPTELEIKSHRVADKLSETLHLMAHEPSLAFYRIEEHIRKTLPHLVDQRREINLLQKDMQGRLFDMEYDIGAIKSIGKSEQSFKNMSELMKNSMFLAQQIQYNKQKRTQVSSSREASSSRTSLNNMFGRSRTVDLAKRAVLTRSVEITSDFGLSHQPSLQDQKLLLKQDSASTDEVTCDNSKCKPVILAGTMSSDALITLNSGVSSRSDE